MRAINLLALALNSAMMLAGRTTMSEYVFFCEECRKEFTQRLHMSDREHETLTCPYCKSTKVQQLVTAFSAVTSKKS
jgi:putative FmdB family regulatory protein